MPELGDLRIPPRRLRSGDRTKASTVFLAAETLLPWAGSAICRCEFASRLPTLSLALLDSISPGLLLPVRRAKARADQFRGGASSAVLVLFLIQYFVPVRQPPLLDENTVIGSCPAGEKHRLPWMTAARLFQSLLSQGRVSRQQRVPEKSGDYKLFCDTHKNINICIPDLSPRPPFSGGQSPGDSLPIALLVFCFVHGTACLC